MSSPMTSSPLYDLVASQNERRTLELMRATADVAVAAIGNNAVSAVGVQDFIRATFETLQGLGTASVATAPAEKLKPAVSIRSSLSDDAIICLEDGKRFKSLKRHLMTHYGLTPDQYRAKWNLPADYPMVAPNYAAARSQLAKKMGLGRKKGQSVRVAA